MNQNDNQLDSFLRRKLDEDTPVFKEEYWGKMTDLLDNEDDNKKGTPWFKRGFILIALTALLGLGTYIYSKIDKKTNETAQNQVNKTENNAQSTNNETTQNETTNNTEQSTTSDSQSIPNDKVISKNNVGSASSSPLAKSTLAMNTNIKEDAQQEVSSANKQSKRPSETDKPAIENEDKLRVRDNKSEISLETNTSKKDKTSIEETTRKSNKLSTKNKTKSNDNQLVKINNSSNTSTETSTQNSEVTKPETITYNGAVLTQKNKETIIPDYTSNPSKYNPRYVPGLDKYQTERVDSIVLITYEPTKSSEQNNEPSTQKKDIEAVSTLDKNWALNFLLGINGNFGMNGTQNRKTSLGISPIVGVGFDYQLSKSLWVHSNLGFSYFNAINTHKTSSNLLYSFGVDSTSTTVEHKQLFQIHLPIGIKYEIMNKHFVIANLGAVMTLDAGSSLSQNNIKSNQMGYRSGFNLFDFMFQVGYEYSLNKRFALYGVYQRGFVDLTKNTYFDNNSSDIQQRITVGIKYNFTSKRQ